MADADLGSASYEVGEKTKKSYVRVMTDKRRLQNRRAQRVYRERLKKKLDGLEEQVAASNSAAGNKSEEVDGGSLHDDGLVSESVGEVVEERSHSSSSIINFNSILEAAGDLAVETSITPQFQFPITPPSPSPPPRVPLYGDAPLPSRPLDIWPMPQRLAGAVYSPPSTASAAYMAGALTALTPDYAWTRQRRLLEQSPDQRSHRNHGTSHHQHHQLQLQHPNPIPSPHINFLNLTSESNLSASLAIALSLGISSDAYLEDHPSTFPRCFDIWYPQFTAPRTLSVCDVAEPGPSVHEFLLKGQNPMSQRYTFVMGQRFVMPLIEGGSEGGSESGSVLSSCQKFRAAAWATVYGAEEYAPTKLRRHMSRIKTPLRPRPVQLLWSHPSYLDCIVFPRFRERAVQASVDGRLDHVEFFLDLMHGGLVCWGNTTPHSLSGRRKKRGRGMAEGVPWSTRSWEARRWFLEKWEWLVGTEEEELAEGNGVEGIWACSRWWWGMRGEVEDGENGEGSDEEGEESESEEAVLRGIYEGRDGSLEGAGRFDLRSHIP